MRLIVQTARRPIRYPDRAPTIICTTKNTTLIPIPTLPELCDTTLMSRMVII